MSDLTDKFAALESQLADQNTAILSALSDLSSALGLIAANIETLNDNSSLNAQRLLSALLALDPCKQCTDAPNLPPPIDTTPQTLDQEHCKRMQALLYALQLLTVKLDLVSSFGAGFSPTVIHDAFSEVITELSSPSGLNLPSFLEVTNLIGALVAYVTAHIFSAGSIPGALAIVHDDLLTALYAATNPNDGLAAYASVISSSSLDSSTQSVLIAIGYVDIFNFYYDPANTIDLTGYDGTLCVPLTGCHTFNSSSIASDYGAATGVVDASPFTGTIHTHYSPAVDFVGNFNGYTITPHDGNLYIGVIFADSSTLGNTNITSPYTFTADTTSFFPNGIAAFEFEICSPE